MKTVYLIGLLALAAPRAVAADAGEALYLKYCAQCHGDAGDGQGHAAGRVKPAPRDFRQGKYKFRTTPSGMLPTDADLERVIRHGLPYTSMPAWPQFKDDEVRGLIEHLKTFSPAFQDKTKQVPPIEIPTPPSITEDSVTQGRAVYEAQGCAACHGQLGRGDGASAPTLTDDWGGHIRPADLTQRWTFRGGPTRQDIFRTFSTGLNGTPMPSYADSLDVLDRWHLVDYIASLGEGDTPDYASLLHVAFVEDEFDLARGAELFAHAAPARFPLLGQVVQPGRAFHPQTTSIRVQAVYNRREIAFLLRWSDMRAETAGRNSPDLETGLAAESAPEAAEAGAAGGEEDIWGEDAAPPAAGGDDFWGEEGGGSAPAGPQFSDAVALQLPATLPTSARKPYFIFGDAQGAVDLWFVDLSRPERVQQFTGHGASSLARSTADDFQVRAAYDQGEWSVIVKRELRSSGNVSFTPEGFVPLAFSVWDGFNEERGNKRALSAWFYLYLEPEVPVSVAGPMVQAGLVALLLECGIVFWIRRRFAAGRQEREPARRAAVPTPGLAQ